MGRCYGLYYSAKRATARRPWTCAGLAVLLMALTIAFMRTNNMTLMLRPAAWRNMVSVFFMKAYRKPRELGWWTGMGLLGLVLLFGFSGYLLPMDELSYSATKVGLEIPAMVPPLAGTDQEINALSAYLDGIVNSSPTTSAQR